MEGEEHQRNRVVRDAPIASCEWEDKPHNMYSALGLLIPFHIPHTHMSARYMRASWHLRGGSSCSRHPYSIKMADIWRVYRGWVSRLRLRVQGAWWATWQRGGAQADGGRGQVGNGFAPLLQSCLTVFALSIRTMALKWINERETKRADGAYVPEQPFGLDFYLCCSARRVLQDTATWATSGGGVVTIWLGRHDRSE